MENRAPHGDRFELHGPTQSHIFDGKIPHEISFPPYIKTKQPPSGFEVRGQQGGPGAWIPFESDVLDEEIECVWVVSNLPQPVMVLRTLEKPQPDEYSTSIWMP